MKHLLLFTFSLTALWSNAFSQEEVRLGMKYRPERKIIQKQEESTKNIITYVGSEEFIKNLENSGTKNPTIKNSKKTMNSSFITGKCQADGSFPMVMEIIESKSSEQKTFPEKTFFYGTAYEDKLPRIDSMSDSGFSEEMKKAIIDNMEKLLSQINIPEVTLKKGESFTHHVPLNLPLGEFDLEMDITSIYTIREIKKKKAYINIDQVLTMKGNHSTYEISAGGSGKGDMLYGMDVQFPLEYNSELSFDMKLSTQDFDLLMRSTTISESTYKIKERKKESGK